MIVEWMGWLEPFIQILASVPWFLVKGYHGLYLEHLIFFVTYEWLHELECYMRLGWKGLPGTNSLAYWVHL